MARTISIDSIEPGMVLAEPVRSINGGILLGQGCTLSEAYINKLQMMDLVEVVVEGEDVNDIDALLEQADILMTDASDVSKKIVEKMDRMFSDVADSKVMQVIKATVQKLLIAKADAKFNKGDQNGED